MDGGKCRNVSAMWCLSVTRILINVSLIDSFDKSFATSSNFQINQWLGSFSVNQNKHAGDRFESIWGILVWTKSITSVTASLTNLKIIITFSALCTEMKQNTNNKNLKKRIKINLVTFHHYTGRRRQVSFLGTHWFCIFIS